MSSLQVVLGLGIRRGTRECQELESLPGLTLLSGWLYCTVGGTHRMEV